MHQKGPAKRAPQPGTSLIDVDAQSSAQEPSAAVPEDASSRPRRVPQIPRRFTTATSPGPKLPPWSTLPIRGKDLPRRVEISKVHFLARYKRHKSSGPAKNELEEYFHITSASQPYDDVFKSLYGFYEMLVFDLCLLLFTVVDPVSSNAPHLI
ncbi:hypothetical protein B0H13DRAFT_2346511 [Mycena leptocephala]|nr:hypothetical protein B0H13DRAFT_2346511 [Mycena leptocephala]